MGNEHFLNLVKIVGRSKVPVMYPKEVPMSSPQEIYASRRHLEETHSLDCEGVQGRGRNGICSGASAWW